MKHLEQSYKFLSGKLDLPSTKDFWSYPITRVLAEISPFGTLNLFEDAIDTMLKNRRILSVDTMKFFNEPYIDNPEEWTSANEITQNNREYLLHHRDQVIKSQSIETTAYTRFHPKKDQLTQISLRKHTQVDGHSFLVPRVLMAKTNILNDNTTQLVAAANLSRNLASSKKFYRFGKVSRVIKDQGQKIAMINWQYEDGRPSTMAGYIGSEEAKSYKRLLKMFDDVEENHAVMCSTTGEPEPILPTPLESFLNHYFRGQNPKV